MHNFVLKALLQDELMSVFQMSVITEYLVNATFQEIAYYDLLVNKLKI
jgi:hypothetical protein